jgi:hypothetical protein
MQPRRLSVSVVIPARNAAATVRETIASVRAQTCQDLEVIVVDDGSSDATAVIARQQSSEDPRIRVVSITHSGVAVARNTGIAMSRGEFIAPLDADDIWHPEKVARQLALLRSDEEVGLVYTLHRRIDLQGRVLGNSGRGPFEGYVYLRMLLHNFVGNGSSAIIRRRALEQVGGYEPNLHRRGAQGCEDYLLQLLVSRAWKVGLVPEYLTGYRKLPGAMSSDAERMARSRLLVLEHVAHQFPETPPRILAASEAMARFRLAKAMLRRRALGAGAAEMWRALSIDADATFRIACQTVGNLVPDHVFGLVSTKASEPEHFLELDPRDQMTTFSHLLEWRLRSLADDEAVFVRSRPATHLEPA